jgi:membrane protease YdiL (CAAX protease family)
MVREYLLLLVALAYPIAAGLLSEKPRRKQRAVTINYLIGTAERSAVLLVLLLIDWRSFIKIDFDKVGRGFFPAKENLWLFVTAFVTPLILVFIPYFRKQFQQEIPGRLYGLPEEELPTGYSEFGMFIFYIAASAVFEELLFRQVGFYSLNAVFNLKGDILLIISSAVFAFAHPYKKIRHIFGIFFSRLLFGKAYQISGTILFPMALHLLANAPIFILSFIRIKKQYT